MQLKSNFSFNIFKNSDCDYLTVKLFFAPDFYLDEFPPNEYNCEESRQITLSAPTKINILYSKNALVDSNNEPNVEYFYLIFRVLGVGFNITRQKGY